VQKILEKLTLLLLTLGLLAACASGNPYYDPSKPHHRPNGFNNNYLDNQKVGEGFWRWQWNSFVTARAPDRPERVPRKAVDLPYLKGNRSDITTTWIGHSTMLWQIGGKNILVDPHFYPRASPVSFAGPARVTPPAIALADLPHIDVVVVSHNHYDHLDRPTVLDLNAQAGGPPLFVVPLGMDLWLKAQGISNVQALDWWQHRDVADIRVTLVPAQHWSARSPFDRHEVLWGGFVVQRDGFSMYYSGDTGYSKDFLDIAARFGGFDFAQIPVGCYEPRWFMGNQHVNEPEAIQIHRDVRSKFSMGVHWGTFRLCDDPVDQVIEEFPKAAQKAGLKPDEFVLPALGETRVLGRGKP
jgi:N-acyl-phosphatidylethanolamine-hydrolysing phospholipase D